MEFSRDELISRCLKVKQNCDQLSLPAARKQANVEITFESTENTETSTINEIDLLTRFPVQECDYLKANLKELNLLNRDSSDESIRSDTKRNILEAWLEFESSEKELEFLPGDSIGTIP